MKIKIYQNGLDFFKDQRQSLFSNELAKMKNVFFYFNAMKLQNCDDQNFAVNISNDKEQLTILSKSPHPTLLFGNQELCLPAVRSLKENHLIIKNIMGEHELVLSFAEAYQKEYELEQRMILMYLQKKPDIKVEERVENGFDVINQLADAYCQYYKEVLKKEISLEESFQELSANAKDFSCLLIGDEVVSFAAKSRDFEETCAISHVYTLPNYRYQGYAKQIVSVVAGSILLNHKIAYLYVDKNNLIAYHVYQKLGFCKEAEISKLRFIEKS